MNKTRLIVKVLMTDKAWPAKLAGLTGVSISAGASSKEGFRTAYEVQITGLRALRVLKDIRDELLGSKREEADKAIKFFSPTGYREGRSLPQEIWPPSEFPLRDSHWVSKRDDIESTKEGLGSMS